MDNDGWSSAEEPINSSDAEEEGRVGPWKLVTLATQGSHRAPWGPGGELQAAVPTHLPTGLLSAHTQ